MPEAFVTICFLIIISILLILAYRGCFGEKIQQELHQILDNLEE